MRRLRAVFSREVMAFLRSPAYWIILSAGWGIAGTSLRFLTLERSGYDLPALLWSSSMTWFWIQLFQTPLLGMRLLSEEKRSGSFEMLVTTPLSDLEIVLGKWASLVVASSIGAAAVWAWQGIGLAARGEPEWGATLAAWSGLVSTAGVFSAVTVLCSALTPHQLLAGFLAFATSLALVLVPSIPFPEWMEAVGAFIRAGNPGAHVGEAAAGVLDARNFSYHLALVFFALLASVRILEVRKWR